MHSGVEGNSKRTLPNDCDWGIFVWLRACVHLANHSESRPALSFRICHHTTTLSSAAQSDITPHIVTSMTSLGVSLPTLPHDVLRHILVNVSDERTLWRAMATCHELRPVAEKALKPYLTRKVVIVNPSLIQNSEWAHSYAYRLHIRWTSHKSRIAIPARFPFESGILSLPPILDMRPNPAQLKEPR